MRAVTWSFGPHQCHMAKPGTLPSHWLTSSTTLSPRIQQAVRLASERKCPVVLAQYALDKFDGNSHASDTWLRTGAYITDSDGGRQRLGFLQGMISVAQHHYEFELNIMGSFSKLRGSVRFTEVVPDTAVSVGKATSPAHGQVQGILSPHHKAGDTANRRKVGGAVFVNAISGTFDAKSGTLTLSCKRKKRSKSMPSLLVGKACRRRLLHVSVDPLWLTGRVRVEEQHKQPKPQKKKKNKKVAKPQKALKKPTSFQKRVVEYTAKRQVVLRRVVSRWEVALALARSAGAPMFCVLDTLARLDDNESSAASWLALRRCAVVRASRLVLLFFFCL